VDEKRIAEMDAARIDVQVLSLNSPGVEQLDAAEAAVLASEANDFVAEAVRRHPSRFAGFAAIPTADPAKAADELERTVRTYGFKGALINGHHRGRYLDDPFFAPILESAQEARRSHLCTSHAAAAAGGERIVRGLLERWPLSFRIPATARG
jgi:predicted TIM-barrel fold metal-dependent hydrolase